MLAATGACAATVGHAGGRSVGCARHLPASCCESNREVRGGAKKCWPLFLGMSAGRSAGAGVGWLAGCLLVALGLMCLLVVKAGGHARERGAHSGIPRHLPGRGCESNAVPGRCWRLLLPQSSLISLVRTGGSCLPWILP